MRTALIIGCLHGDDAFRVLEIGEPQDINKAYKEAMVTVHGFAELQLWESSAGVTKRKRFEATEEALATARAGFKKAAAYEAEIEALRERIAALESAADKAAADKAAADKAAADKAAADKAAADKAAADKAGNKTVVGGK